MYPKEVSEEQTYDMDCDITIFCVIFKAKLNHQVIFNTNLE